MCSSCCRYTFHFTTSTITASSHFGLPRVFLFVVMLLNIDGQTTFTFGPLVYCFLHINHNFLPFFPFSLSLSLFVSLFSWLSYHCPHPPFFSGLLSSRILRFPSCLSWKNKRPSSLASSLLLHIKLFSSTHFLSRHTNTWDGGRWRGKHEKRKTSNTKTFRHEYILQVLVTWFQWSISCEKVPGVFLFGPLVVNLFCFKSLISK